MDLGSMLNLHLRVFVDVGLHGSAGLAGRAIHNLCRPCRKQLPIHTLIGQRIRGIGGGVRLARGDGNTGGVYWELVGGIGRHLMADVDGNFFGKWPRVVDSSVFVRGERDGVIADGARQFHTGWQRVLPFGERAHGNAIVHFL
jgi:hypothetical protein